MTAKHVLMGQHGPERWHKKVNKHKHLEGMTTLHMDLDNYRGCHYGGSGFTLLSSRIYPRGD